MIDNLLPEKEHKYCLFGFLTRISPQSKHNSVVIAEELKNICTGLREYYELKADGITALEYRHEYSSTPFLKILLGIDFYHDLNHCYYIYEGFSNFLEDKKYYILHRHNDPWWGYSIYLGKCIEGELYYMTVREDLKTFMYEKVKIEDKIIFIDSPVDIKINTNYIDNI